MSETSPLIEIAALRVMNDALMAVLTIRLGADVIADVRAGCAVQAGFERPIFQGQAGTVTYAQAGDRALEIIDDLRLRTAATSAH